MILKIGDKVRYLNDVGGGRVTKILDNNMVEIENEFGFEVPVMLKELVAVDKTENEIEETKQEDSILTVEEPTNDLSVFDELPEVKSNEAEIYFAVTKEEDSFNCYIINDSDFDLFCNIMHNKNNEFENIFSSKLEAGLKENFIQFNGSQLQEGLDLVFQIVFVAKSQKSIQSPVEKAISLTAVKLIKEGSYKENDYFHQPAILTTIFEYGLKNEVEKLSSSDIKKIIEQKQVSDKYTEQLSTKYKTQKNIEIVEIDLHIQEVLDDIKNLSNTEMLMAQIQKFHSEMKAGIEKRVNKIVFIHGVGNGTLKNELRKSLQQDYPKYKFQDASFQEYGFGATMVYVAN